MIDVLFGGTAKALTEIETLTQRIQAEENTSVHEIRDWLYPLNAVVSTYDRTYGPPWGPTNSWHEWTEQAYRMGAQLLIEESEEPGAPWVRVWLGHADEVPGSTPPELVALREWLNSHNDGEQIPKNLLDHIDLKDPALERKSRSEWLKIGEGGQPYSRLTEELRLAHAAIRIIPRLVPELTKLLEAAVNTVENEINRQPEDITRARGEAILESSQSGIPTGTTTLHTPSQQPRETTRNLVSH